MYRPRGGDVAPSTIYRNSKSAKLLTPAGIAPDATRPGDLWNVGIMPRRCNKFKVSAAPDHASRAACSGGPGPALLRDERRELRPRHAVDHVPLCYPRAAGDVDAEGHELQLLDAVGVGVDREHHARLDRGACVQLVEVEARVARVDLQHGTGVGRGFDDLVHL